MKRNYVVQVNLSITIAGKEFSLTKKTMIPAESMREAREIFEKEQMFRIETPNCKGVNFVYQGNLKKFLKKADTSEYRFTIRVAK